MVVSFSYYRRCRSIILFSASHFISAPFRRIQTRTITIGGSIERRYTPGIYRGARNDTKVYGARP
jgi:hypothetical protein